MNAVEFNELIAKVVSRGLNEGVQQGKMDPLQIVGSLEFQKAGVISMMERAAAQAAQSPIVAPTRMDGIR